MKALVQPCYKSPEALRIERLDAPEPEPDEALIRIRAAAINRTDCAILWSEPFFMRFMTGLRRPSKPIPGTAFAGEIERVGPAVRGFAPGDRVWGFDDSGARCLAEHATASTRRGLSKMPAGLSFEQAAACVEGGHYAINFLNKVALQQSQRALVNGATGAIGSAAVQLLAHEGVRVTAVCAGSHAETARALGAERVMDFEAADFTSCGERFDYVFDTVGKSDFGRCKPILNERGIYISSELGRNWQNPFLAIATAFSRGRRVKFPFPYDVNASLRILKERVEAGSFAPLMDRVYGLGEAAEAFRYVASGRKIGNVVVRID